MPSPPLSHSPFASSNSSTTSFPHVTTALDDHRELADPIRSRSPFRRSRTPLSRASSPMHKPTMTTTATVAEALPPYRAPTFHPPTYTLLPSGRFLDLELRTPTSTQYYLSVLPDHNPPLLLRSGPTASSPIIAALRFGKFPDGQLCLGDPQSHPASVRWTPWTRELGFKTFSFSIPGPNGGASGSRRLRWEKSRSRKYGLSTLGRTKGWVLRNLDTDEVLASFKQEKVGVGREDEPVGQVRWWSDVTSDEEVGATTVLVGMWFRMSQLDVGGEYERVMREEEERRSLEGMGGPDGEIGGVYGDGFGRALAGDEAHG
ncbi:hypothetical protein CAC42_8255 [Sphaceloma murrayae]|uniref:Uncharacterized protein n=1 Tax=Sphaceloma murrayae TaxID=2082308 RepID=A0A2K1QJA8_9PEZI|nr:hypothetical protein CAC42_8255 [Sphaceloma murrayae]